MTTVVLALAGSLSRDYRISSGSCALARATTRIPRLAGICNSVAISTPVRQTFDKKSSERVSKRALFNRITPKFEYRNLSYEKL